MLVVLQIALIIILVILIGVSLRDYFINEYFHDNWQGQIRYKPFTDIAKHVRLNKFNQPDQILTRPPQPRTGETYCGKVNCPVFMDRDTICWRCQ